MLLVVGRVFESGLGLAEDHGFLADSLESFQDAGPSPSAVLALPVFFERNITMSSSPETAHFGWQHSPDHNANMVSSDWRFVGMGYFAPCADVDTETFCAANYVQLFGK